MASVGAGVSFFASPDYVIAVDLQERVDELVVVGDSFHVKPLIRVMQAGDRYQLLCFSEKNIELFEIQEILGPQP